MIYKKVLEQLKSSAVVAIALNGKYKGKYVIYMDKKYLGEDIPDIKEKVSTITDSGIYNINGTDFFVHCIGIRPTVNIFGAGHVSKALVSVCAMLGFYVRVIDNRKEFAKKEYFPDADEVVLCDFNDINIALQPSDYNIIVTSGHKHDMECAEFVLSKKFFYLGIIGSKTKAALMYDKLLAKGFSADVLSRINSPIGLKIGAQTPEEIAISIAAQMIEKKYENPVWFIPKKLENLILSDKEYTLGIIIEKNGSAPRGIGSMMAVCNDTSVGTIGGGAAEFEFKENAAKLNDMTIVDYDMTPLSGGNMVCGGNIRILVLKNK